MLRLLTALVPAVASLVAWAAALGFPVTERVHEQVVAGIRVHERGLQLRNGKRTFYAYDPIEVRRLRAGARHACEH